MSEKHIIAFSLDTGQNQDAFLKEECQQAINGILDFNHFRYLKAPDARYKIKLSCDDGYLVFRFADESDRDLPLLAISARPYKKLISDYFMMVESYEQTRAHSPYKLEAIDMGRRGIHDEAAQLLIERLKGKIEMDFETARRLFTLICVLHLNRRNLI